MTFAFILVLYFHNSSVPVPFPAVATNAECERLYDKVSRKPMYGPFNRPFDHDCIQVMVMK